MAQVTSDVEANMWLVVCSVTTLSVWTSYSLQHLWQVMQIIGKQMVQWEVCDYEGHFGAVRFQGICQAG
jgi:hypothetical protein